MVYASNTSTKSCITGAIAEAHYGGVPPAVGDQVRRLLETYGEPLLRIVDESGEDYLYPKTFFREIALPLAVKRAVLAA